MVVRDTAGDYDFDWHPSPARQFVVNLDGPVRIEVSDGTSKVCATPPARGCPCCTPLTLQDALERLTTVGDIWGQFQN